MKTIDTDYKLIPMADITDEAKDIAVRWIESFKPTGFSIREKHKLASDIMNYARRFHELKVELILEHLRKQKV
jgi:hypothetical protein